MGEIRIGKVSAIDAETGHVRVVYTDKNNAVTALLPLLNHEYNMPSVDDMVLVLHLSNGNEKGVVIGSFWGQKLPEETGIDLYKKKFNKSGDSFIKYEGGTLTFKSLSILFDGSVTFGSNNGSITLDELIQMKADINTLNGFHS